MNFPTITRYNWMCCSIILVFLALSSPKPLQAQENQKERITIQVKNQPIQKVFDDLSKQTGLKFFYGEAIANRNVQVNLKFKNAPINSVLNEITRQANLYFKRENNTIAVSLGNAGKSLYPPPLKSYSSIIRLNWMPHCSKSRSYESRQCKASRFQP